MTFPELRTEPRTKTRPKTRSRKPIRAAAIAATLAVIFAAGLLARPYIGTMTAGPCIGDAIDHIEAETGYRPRHRLDCVIANIEGAQEICSVHWHAPGAPFHWHAPDPMDSNYHPSYLARFDTVASAEVYAKKYRAERNGKLVFRCKGSPEARQVFNTL